MLLSFISLCRGSGGGKACDSFYLCILLMKAALSRFALKRLSSLVLKIYLNGGFILESNNFIVVVVVVVSVCLSVCLSVSVSLCVNLHILFVHDDF